MLLAVRWAWTPVREGPRMNFAVASKGDAPLGTSETINAGDLVLHGYSELLQCEMTIQGYSAGGNFLI